MQLNFRSLDAAFDMGFSWIFSNGGNLPSGNTVFSFMGDGARSGDPANFFLYGTNITIDPVTGMPTGGMIHTLSINFDEFSGSGLDSHIDFSVSFFNSPIPVTSIVSPPNADQNYAADKFWSAFLSGNDEILAPDHGNVRIYGDFFQIKATVFFDDNRTGGNDTITADTVHDDTFNQVTGFLSGDADIVTGSTGRFPVHGSLTGGDDTIAITGTLAYAAVVGDAESVGATGDLTGGDDHITSTADWDLPLHPVFSRISGDAEISQGRVTGGNDVIAGSNFALFFLKEAIAGDINLDESQTSQGGNDTIFGGGGNDQIAGDDISAQGGVATGGDDVLQGGDHSDTVAGDMLRQDSYFPGDGSQVDATVFGGNDTVLGDQSNDLLAGDVYVLFTTGTGSMTGGNDSLFGGGDGDQLFGDIAVYAQTNTATLVETGGNDTLNGGVGADTMTGGLGNDLYWVDNAGDQVVEKAQGGTDWLSAFVSYVLGAGQSIETVALAPITGTAALSLIGNEFAQRLIGNAGDNTLRGGGGDDTAIGHGGNDTYFVDHGGDSVVEAAGEGTDKVFTYVSYQLAAGQSIEALAAADPAGTALINLIGNGIAQTITGNTGIDFLNGGGGADTLVGLGGDDRFDFTTPLGGGNVDHITGFAVGHDKIRLDDAIFPALGPSVMPNEFHIGASALTATQHLIYNSTTGALIYDSNGNVAGGAMQFASLATGLNVASTDFTII